MTKDRKEALNAVQNNVNKQGKSVLNYKITAFLVAIAVVVLCVAAAGCIFSSPESEPSHMELPFAAEDVSGIEIWHTEGTKAAVPKGESTDSLYNLLKTTSLEKVDKAEVSGVAKSGIRLLLSDGRKYEIVYVSVGVKNGYLYDISGNQMYFTRADIEGVCNALIEEYGGH